MKPEPYPITFRGDDLRPLDADALSLQLRVSRAFVRVCFCAGCPAPDGKQAAADLLLWLFDHYENVRALVGLKPLPTVEGVSESAALQIRMANGLCTLLEYSRSRTSNHAEKKRCQRMQRVLENALDQA